MHECKGRRGGRGTDEIPDTLPAVVAVTLQRDGQHGQTAQPNLPLLPYLARLARRPLSSVRHGWRAVLRERRLQICRDLERAAPFDLAPLHHVDELAVLEQRDGW